MRRTPKNARKRYVRCSALISALSAVILTIHHPASKPASAAARSRSIPPLTIEPNARARPERSDWQISPSKLSESSGAVQRPLVARPVPLGPKGATSCEATFAVPRERPSPPSPPPSTPPESHTRPGLLPPRQLESETIPAGGFAPSLIVFQSCAGASARSDPQFPRIVSTSAVLPRRSATVDRNFVSVMFSPSNGVGSNCPTRSRDFIGKRRFDFA